MFTRILHTMVNAGVFQLPAFTSLGHERQDLFKSVRWSTCGHRLDISLYSHPKELLGHSISAIVPFECERRFFLPGFLLF